VKPAAQPQVPKLTLIEGRGSPETRFAALVQPHYDVLYRVAYRFTRSVHDAEDLAQEVCVRAYPRLAELEQLEQPRGWLLRVLYRLFVDSVRRRLRFGVEHRDANRRLRVSYEFEAQDRVDPGVSPDRNRLQLRLGQRLRSRWSIDGGLAYRTSRYGKLAVPRNERLVELVVGARRTLRNDWALNTDYRWADNNSNIALFGYTSRRVTVGVSRTF
jgi:RNA polymerase sigma factor (sigma-70 family)